MADKPYSKYDPRWNDIDREVWKLRGSLDPIEAAALIANIDPGAISTWRTFDGQTLTSKNYTDDIRPGRASAVFAELIKAIQNGELKATMPEPPPEPDDDAPF